MLVLVLSLALFFFSGSESFAQVYKYVDKNGTLCFSDSPKSSDLDSAQKGSIEVRGTGKSVAMNIKEEIRKIKNDLSKKCLDYSRDSKEGLKKYKYDPCDLLSKFTAAVSGVKTRRSKRGRSNEDDFPDPPMPDIAGPYIRSGSGYIGPDGFSPDLGGGIVNPRTGEFMPKVGGGFIEPNSGRFSPSF